MSDQHATGPRDEGAPLDEGALGHLLDDHLNRLDDRAHDALMAAMERDPALAERYARVGRVLRPLDAWSVSEPSNVADRVLARVDREVRDAPVLPESLMPASSGWRRPFASLREVIAAAAAIALAFLILVPGLATLRDRSQRIRCADHLGSIGRAVAAYAAAHGDSLPRVAIGPGGAWLPRGGDADGRGATPNSQSRFLLLRFRYVPNPDAFVCPSSRDSEPMQLERIDEVADFPEARNCNYDSLNVAGHTPEYGKKGRLPYMSDANPLFVGRSFHAVDPATTNSRNHGRAAGQNVLYLDGSVSWQRTPNCGFKGDNIWQAGDLRRYRGTEAQRSATDTFLVP